MKCSPLHWISLTSIGSVLQALSKGTSSTWAKSVHKNEHSPEVWRSDNHPWASEDHSHQPHPPPFCLQKISFFKNAKDTFTFWWSKHDFEMFRNCVCVCVCERERERERDAEILRALGPFKNMAIFLQPTLLWAKGHFSAQTSF